MVACKVVVRRNCAPSTGTAGSFGGIQVILLKAHPAHGVIAKNGVGWPASAVVCSFACEPADGVGQRPVSPGGLIVVVTDSEGRRIGLACQTIERVIAIADRNVSSVRLAG